MKATDFSSAHWRKSSRSGGNSGQCVEVAEASEVVGVRDSKNPGVLTSCWTVSRSLTCSLG